MKQQNFKELPLVAAAFLTGASFTVGALFSTMYALRCTESAFGCGSAFSPLISGSGLLLGTLVGALSLHSWLKTRWRTSIIVPMLSILYTLTIVFLSFWIWRRGFAGLSLFIVPAIFLILFASGIYFFEKLDRLYTWSIAGILFSLSFLVVFLYAASMGI